MAPDPPRTLSTEEPPQASPVGSVVLDLGDSIGAAILTTPAALVGAEIELRPAHGRWTGTHVAVLRRDVQGGPIYAATFTSLPAGHYELRIRNDDGGPVVPVLVNGGRVEITAWPGADA